MGFDRLRFWRPTTRGKHQPLADVCVLMGVGTELNGLVKHCGSYCQSEGVMDASKKSCLELEAKTLQPPFSLGPNVLV